MRSTTLSSRRHADVNERSTSKRVVANSSLPEPDIVSAIKLIRVVSSVNTVAIEESCDPGCIAMVYTAV